jgi:hypothetical protein
MMPLLILGGVLVLYELVTNKQLVASLSSDLGIATTATTAAGGTTTASQPATNLVAPAAVAANAQKESAALNDTALESSAVGASLNFIPVVGPIVSAVYSAISSIFLAASKKRAAEAENENAAVANFLPAFDQGVTTIVTAYNKGQITNTEAVQLFETLWSNYWSECTPQIQPGRNGCNSGTLINASGSNFLCSGSWGAACCVGGGVIRPSIYHLENAINLNASTGQPQKAYVQPVYPSKYGGTARQGYYVPIGATATGGVTQCGGGSVPPCEAINAAQQAAEHIPAGTALPTV